MIRIKPSHSSDLWGVICKRQTCQHYCPLPLPPTCQGCRGGGRKKKIWLCKDPVPLQLQIDSFKVNCCFTNMEENTVKINDGDSSLLCRMSFHRSWGMNKNRENTHGMQWASGVWWHLSSECALNFSREALCPSLTWIISSEPIRKRTPDDKHPGIMLSIHLPHLSVWQSISCRQVGSSYKVAMSVASGWIAYHSKGPRTLDM